MECDTLNTWIDLDKEPPLVLQACALMLLYYTSNQQNLHHRVEFGLFKLLPNCYF